MNISENIISISFGHPAVLYGGITLLPGDSLSMDQFLFTTQAMNAISSAASSALSVQEFQ